MVTHSSILAWEIPLTEEPGRLHSMGSQRVGQDWATKQQRQRGRGKVGQQRVEEISFLWTKVQIKLSTDKMLREISLGQN